MWVCTGLLESWWTDGLAGKSAITPSRFKHWSQFYALLDVGGIRRLWNVGSTYPISFDCHFREIAVPCCNAAVLTKPARLTDFLNSWFVACTAFLPWTCSSPDPRQGSCCFFFLSNIYSLLQAALFPLLLLQVSEVWDNSSVLLVLLNLFRFFFLVRFYFQLLILFLVYFQKPLELFSGFKSVWIKWASILHRACFYSAALLTRFRAGGVGVSLNVSAANAVTGEVHKLELWMKG